MSGRVTVIAEAGVNHNGDLGLALELVRRARASGADCVKFQTFSAERLVTRDAPKAEYQTRVTDAAESQFAMLQRREQRLYPRILVFAAQGRGMMGHEQNRIAQGNPEIAIERGG